MSSQEKVTDNSEHQENDSMSSEVKVTDNNEQKQVHVYSLSSQGQVQTIDFLN